MSDVVWVDPDQVTAASAALGLLGADLRRGAGGFDRSVPPVPEDEHGVAAALIAFDEAREAVEHRIGSLLCSSQAAIDAVLGDTATADRPVMVELPADPSGSEPGR